MTADILILLEEKLISITVIIFQELHNSLDNCFHNNEWQCIKQETVITLTLRMLYLLHVTYDKFI